MADGKDYKTTRKLVVRRPTLSSCFTASRTTVQVGKGVEFDSSCLAGTPTNYLWDIRGADNPDLPLGQSGDPGYSFVFDAPGQYQVSLTLQDAFENRDTKTIVITVVP
jgi:PKD repeat protein